MIEINKKYGCLTILDLGQEYSQSEKYLSYIKQKEFLEKEINPYIEERNEVKQCLIFIS